MLYSCVAKHVEKAVKDSWSLAKGITGNKNFNPRPKEREGEGETLFLDNPGASVTKIPSDPLQPSDKYHKAWPLSILSLPSHFLMCNLIRFLCSFVSGTDRYWKYFRSHLYEAAGLRPGTLEPGQPPPFDNLAAPRREFYFHQVVWLADLLPLPVLFAHLPLQPDVWSPAHCWLAMWSSVMPTCASSAQPFGAKEAFLSFHLHSSDAPAFLTFFSGHVPILYLGVFLHGFTVKVT